LVDRSWEPVGRAGSCQPVGFANRKNVRRWAGAP